MRLSRGCVLAYCECRDRSDVVTDLIHKRDTYANTHTATARLEEGLLDFQIDYIDPRDEMNAMEPEELEAAVASELDYWTRPPV